MKFCPKCGTQLADDDRFCSKCGTSVDFDVNKGTYRHQDAVEMTKPQMSVKPKQASPILGIVAFVLALVGFFGDPPALTVIVSIFAFVLAVVALKKKSRLKGFAIVAIIFVAYNLFATFFLRGNTASKQEAAETVVEGSSAYVEEENATEAREAEEISYTDYSIGGITFKIPSTYGYSEEEEAYISADENKLIHFEDGGEGITDDQFKSAVAILDEKTDEVAEGFLSNYERKSGLENKIAGFLGRSYCYVGEYEEKDSVLYIDYINNTENNKEIIVIGVAMDADKEVFESEYQQLINSAEYTNASAAVTESASQETQAEGPVGVDPDLVAFLTEYEKFIDSYCEFMEKYYKNPSDLSMLTDYAEFMKQYAEFADKVDAYDSDEMSTADASYYIEVTARCSQKMLQLAGSMGGN